VTITLLLDLDDTLLINPMDGFLPAYLKGLAGRLARFVEPERMIQALLAATGQMTRTLDPTRTLEQVFDDAFYPALGLTKEALRPALEAYYAQDFPLLQPLTRPHPHASALIHAARARGWRVGLATNPIFPRTAIQQRIRWAGLEPGDFDWTPAYESFHFAKPTPAYFAEFLAQMGWPAGPVVMVGDDLENDIRPARRLSLATYHLNGPADPDQAGGRLEDLIPWIESARLPATANDLAAASPAPEVILSILRSTPAAISALSENLTPEEWAVQPGEEHWNLTEIACHLRDAELEVNLPRLQQFMTEEDPFLAGVDTDRWAVERKYAAQDGLAALRAFVAARARSLELLQTLSAAAWLRTARHAIFGPTTLQEIVSIIASHDRLHVQQFKQVLA